MKITIEIKGKYCGNCPKQYYGECGTHYLKCREFHAGLRNTWKGVKRCPACLELDKKEGG